jgi:hypothetical protein
VPIVLSGSPFTTGPSFGSENQKWYTVSQIWFGNNTIPVIGGTQPWIDLNDGTSWYAQDIGIIVHRQLGVGQKLFQSDSVWLSDDFAPYEITIRENFDEGGGGKFFAAKALLLQLGEQWLSFDGGQTGILVKCSDIASQSPFFLAGAHPPYVIDTELHFLSRGQFQDISSTSLGSTALNSGTATNFNITYTGAFFTRPIWTLSIPNTNAVAIQSFVLKNTTSGALITIDFRNNGAGGATGLAASTTWTITIDCVAMTVIDQNGNNYNMSTSSTFPILYPPSGTVNAMQATLTPNSGTATGCTINGTWNARWQL